MSRLSVGLGSLQTLGENLILALSSSWWLWLFLGGVCTIPSVPTATMPSLLHQSFACLSSKWTLLIVFMAHLIAQHSLSNPYFSTSSKTLIPNKLEFTSSKDFIIMPWLEREQGFIFKIHYVM